MAYSLTTAQFQKSIIQKRPIRVYTTITVRLKIYLEKRTNAFFICYRSEKLKRRKNTINIKDKD